jgi:hypothetical protein
LHHGFAERIAQGKIFQNILIIQNSFYFCTRLERKNEKQATDKQLGKLVLAQPLRVAVGSIVGLYSVQSGHVVYSMPALYLVNS